MNATKKIVVYAAGVFDILHVGHIRYLEKAKALGDVLVVGLLTDEGTKAYKYKYPIIPFLERWEILHSIKPIDYVVAQNSTDPTFTLQQLKLGHNDLFPDILVRGDDVSLPVPGQEFVESQGGKVVILPYTKKVSSTLIKKRIKNV